MLPYPTFMPLKRKQMLLYAGMFEPRNIRFLLIANKIRPLVKSVYRKINFLISQPKHVLKLMGKDIFSILR